MNKSEVISFITDQMFSKRPDYLSEASAQGQIVAPTASAKVSRRSLRAGNTKAAEGA